MHYCNCIDSKGEVATPSKALCNNESGSLQPLTNSVVVTETRNFSLILVHSRRVAFSRISKFLLNLASHGKFFVILPGRRNSDVLANPRKFSHILTDPLTFSQTQPKFPLLLSGASISHKFSRNLPPVLANPRPFSQNLAHSRRISPVTHAFPRTNSRSIPQNLASSRRISRAYHTFSQSLADPRPFSRAQPHDLPAHPRSRNPPHYRKLTKWECDPPTGRGRCTIRGNGRRQGRKRYGHCFSMAQQGRDLGPRLFMQGRSW